MPEEDYQRGLRGGPERVSVSDWKRWQDWKAGHDEYERRQEEEDDARFAEVATPEQTRARLLARIEEREKANEKKLARLYEEERRYRENERRLKAGSNNLDDGWIVFVSIFSCVAGLVIGLILKWIFGVPVTATLLVTMGLGTLLLVSMSGKRGSV